MDQSTIYPARRSALRRRSSSWALSSMLWRTNSMWSRASEELHLTQSAVSRQINQLESQLGLALFHRVRQRLVLTDAGRVYAANVRVVMQQLSGATQKTMSWSDGAGLLNLAVLPTLADPAPG